jgi:hypothetical protein
MAPPTVRVGANVQTIVSARPLRIGLDLDF